MDSEEETSSSSSTDDEQTSTDCTTDSSDDDEKLEKAEICGSSIELPQGLCERKDIFDEFFSAYTWNSLTDEQRQHLRKFLPAFPENDQHEKNVTLQRLLNGQVFRFSSPLEDFYEHLKAGHYRPDIARMKTLIRRAERNEAKLRHKLQRQRLVNDVRQSRHRLHSLVRSLPPGVEVKMDRVSFDTSGYHSPVPQRAKQRYFQELATIRQKVEETGISSDDNYPEGPSARLTKRQKRHLHSIKNPFNFNGERIISTSALKEDIDLEQQVAPQNNPFFITEETYKTLILSYKRKRARYKNDPEYNTSDTKITDIINRTDLSDIKKLGTISATMPSSSTKHQLEFKSVHRKKLKKEQSQPVPPSPELLGKANPFFGHSSNSELDSDSDSLFDSFNCVSAAPKTKVKTKKPLMQRVKLEVKSEPLDAFAPILPEPKPSLVDSPKPVVSTLAQYGKIAPATLSDLDGIDMMNIPIDLEDSNIDILEFNNKPELMQDTHANFLSLIRDIICSTNEHRMTMEILEDRLRSWQENPISPLNDWYSLVDNWVLVLPSAISFLSGNFTDQPDDFVPYIEYKPQLDVHQWIGAGRDSDSLLMPLSHYWLERRSEIKPALQTLKDKEEELEVTDQSQTPPPPRFPTAWTVRKADVETVSAFQEQERRRYTNPHKAFTYRCNGYESVVGPVKGIYTNQNMGSTKARGHSMLTADRPNFVTILTLVRDATARLPNGEGTRADICELLKSSQYISSSAPDNVLQSVVSGALDRMHTQFDPCVKYDTKRKVWIYLHRNRSEEDFERLHQQHQGMSRTTKKAVPKSKSPAKPRTKPEKLTKPAVSAKPIQDSNQPPNQLETVKPEEDSKKLPIPNNVESSVTSTPQVVIPTTAVVTTKPSLAPISHPKKIVAVPAEKHPLLVQKKEAIAVSSSSATRKSPAKNLQQTTALKKEDSPSRVSSPLTKSVSKATKNALRVVTANHAKSAVAPASTGVKQAVEKSFEQKATKAPLAHQLLQTITPKQKQLLMQKQNTVSDIEQNLPVQQKLSKTTVASLVPVQTATPQLQTIKTASVARKSPPIIPIRTQSPATLVHAPDANAAPIVIDDDVPAVAVVQNAVVTEHVVQSGVQNKTPARLTPVQQQQILQTLKQKVMPVQQAVVGTQYKTIAKQKPVAVQLAKQQAVPGTSLLTHGKTIVADGVAMKPITPPAPLVAKVLTNAAGQVISVESLLAHQKQHGTLPQGTTLRISGTKSGQPNVIQLASPTTQGAVTQFTVTQPGIVAVSNHQSKLVHSAPIPTTASTATVTVSKPPLKAITKTQTTAKISPKVAQQLINAKFIAQTIGGTQKLVQPKVLIGPQTQLKMPSSGKNITPAVKQPVGINMATANAAGTIRMVNTANLNLAQIGGKPVLITSKGGTFQNIQGQNIIIQTQANTTEPDSTSNIAQGTSATIQNTQSTQMILSPPLKVHPSQVVLSGTVKPSTVTLPQGGQAGAQAQIVTLGGQAVRLQTAAGGSNAHRVVLASQNQGQIITQQILLPVGFQGAPFNIKALQGLKVVPIAQQGRGVQGRQVFARVMNPANIVRVAPATAKQEPAASTKPPLE